MNRRNFIRSTGAATGLALLSPLISHATTAGAISITSGKRSPAISPITEQEREERREKARRLMAANKLDAIILEGGASMHYFSGVSWGRSERLFLLIIPQKGDAFYIAPKFEESRAKEQVKEARLYTWQENESPFELIAKILKEHGLNHAHIGVEESTRYFVTDNLRKAASGVVLESAMPVTAGCRSIKSAHEIELMQAANDITAQVFSASIAFLKEGMTEREFGKILSTHFTEAGAPGGALVLFGEATAYPHGLVKENKLKEGDLVLIDGGCTVEGYESDITRTTVFGKPSDTMKKVWELVRKAQDAGVKAAKPGVPAEDIDAAARKVICQGGYGPGYTFFTHRLGHGIGLEGHEWYYLVGGNKRPVQNGNLFSNEPGIYIPGSFGIRLEDELLITSEGARLLLPQAESFSKLF